MSRHERGDILMECSDGYTWPYSGIRTRATCPLCYRKQRVTDHQQGIVLTDEMQIETEGYDEEKIRALAIALRSGGEEAAESLRECFETREILGGYRH